MELTEKRKLLNAAGSAVELVKNFSGLEEYFPATKRECFEKMLATLSDGGAYFSSLCKRMEAEKIAPIFEGDELYPKAFAGLEHAPLCLYAKGNTRLLEERLFAVVGSRRTVETARKAGKQIAEALSHSFTVLTGAADGGDEAAIEGAFAGSGKVIALIAGGFSATPQGNLPLLKRVEETGLLLSACSYDTPVRVYSYEVRNELLAALSVGVLVLGAAKKSGALITAKYAKEQGKPLFAIPYPLGTTAGEGCNALIKAGARLTESAADIFQAFGMEAAEERQVALGETEAKTLEALKELSEAHIGELSKTLGLPVFKLTATLAALEMKGLAVKLGGNRYGAV